MYTLRYFLRFSYSGIHYFGFQRQPHHISVQQKLEEALSMILRQPIEITGAGRTDTGVHAREMYAHFDTQSALPSDLIYRLNSVLPKDIAVDACLPVVPEAHARFDALSRTYEYHISFNKDPFRIGHVCQFWHKTLDFEAMESACNYLLGERDFSSFEKKGSDNKTSFCDVTEARWTRLPTGIYFTVTANRFLRNMVRSMVGTLVEVGMHRRTPESLPALLDKKNREEAGLSMPADGLYLTHIRYPESLFLKP